MEFMHISPVFLILEVTLYTIQSTPTLLVAKRALQPAPKRRRPCRRVKLTFRHACPLRQEQHAALWVNGAANAVVCIWPVWLVLQYLIHSQFDVVPLLRFQLVRHVLCIHGFKTHVAHGVGVEAHLGRHARHAGTVQYTVPPAEPKHLQYTQTQVEETRIEIGFGLGIGVGSVARVLQMF